MTIETVVMVQGREVRVDQSQLNLVLGFKWFIGKDGYAAYYTPRNGGKQKRIKLHHLLFGKQPGLEPDHRDGNKLNNTSQNIRWITHRQNTQNAGIRKDNKTGFKGVTTTGKRFKCAIREDGKVKHIGTFDDKQDAATAYNFEAYRVFGEYARFNEVDQPWLKEA